MVVSPRGKGEDAVLSSAEERLRRKKEHSLNGECNLNPAAAREEKTGSLSEKKTGRVSRMNE